MQEGTHNPFLTRDNPLAIYVWIFIALLAGVPLLTIIFLFSAPSHYDPYNPDFVEEIRPDRSVADLKRIEQEAQADNHRLPRPGEGYAHFNKHRETNKKLRYANSVTIVVLGDLGRSPRMSYHAASLASKGIRVELVGYVDSPLPSFLKATKHVRVHRLWSLPAFLSHLPFLFIAPVKLVQQSWLLYRTLCYGVKTPTKHMLLQIPPSMPTLLICLVACFIRNTTLICDWHNTGSSILALRFKRNQKHPIVKVARWFELTLARRASGHLTVSKAMKRYLIHEARIDEKKIAVVRDRPSLTFRPLENDGDRTRFLERCEVTKEFVKDLSKGNGWRLVVSSTSWTADEDFGLLLNALVTYSSQAMEKSLPNLLVIITGKGPQKEYYLRQISELNQTRKLDKIMIKTTFLPYEGYARLLACADLGVCLHDSSSGLDLPMKVVDMFGAGLPVAAYGGYEAFTELIDDGKNGKGFQTDDDLAQIITSLFSHGGADNLQALANGARQESSVRWEQEWESFAGPMLGLKSL